jgi:hypothetical protein
MRPLRAVSTILMPRVFVSSKRMRRLLHVCECECGRIASTFLSILIISHRAPSHSSFFSRRLCTSCDERACRFVFDVHSTRRRVRCQRTARGACQRALLPLPLAFLHRGRPTCCMCTKFVRPRRARVCDERLRPLPLRTLAITAT